MPDNNNIATQKEDKEEQQFIIQRIYLKDVSFESPNTPDIYAEDWTPETNLEMSSEAKVVGDFYYEVVLKFTITVKNADKVAFLVEISQAGVFEIKGYNQAQLNQLLASYCPSTLFPYAREAIASLVSKGSFPEMHLSPINFEALYTQRIAEEKKLAEETKKSEA